MTNAQTSQIRAADTGNDSTSVAARNGGYRAPALSKIGHAPSQGGRLSSVTVNAVACLNPGRRMSGSVWESAESVARRAARAAPGARALTAAALGSLATSSSSSTDGQVDLESRLPQFCSRSALSGGFGKYTNILA